MKYYKIRHKLQNKSVIQFRWLDGGEVFHSIEDAIRWAEDSGHKVSANHGHMWDFTIELKDETP